MQVTVISDPHGDLVALRAVVADLDTRGLDEVLVAGDLAQGGPIARGNSDDFLVSLATGRDLGFDAPAELMERRSWSVVRLGKKRIERMAALPIVLRRPWAPNGRLVVVHATPPEHRGSGAARCEPGNCAADGVRGISGCAGVRPHPLGVSA